MLETRAIIIKIQGNEAMVEAIGEGGCGHCSSENGCGSGTLGKLFCSHPRQFKVLNEAQAVVGEEVQITLQDGVLLRSSMLLYVLPLVLLLAGGMLGSLMSSNPTSKDGFAAAGSLLGMVAGFLLAKWLAKRFSVVAVAKPLSSVLS